MNYLILFLALMPLSSAHVTGDRPSRECVDPPAHEIAAELLDIYTDPLYQGFTKNIIPCHRARTLAENGVIYRPYSEPNVPHGFCNSSSASGATHCQIPPSGVFQQRGHHHHRKSQCSWHYELDYDVDRIPSTIARAVCNCRRCVHNGRHALGRCRPSLSYIPVLVRKCEPATGFYSYQKAIEEVPVSCTCVGNRHAASLSLTNRRVMED